MAKTEIQNVLQPGKTYRVDAEKFAAVRDAVLAVLAPDGPGLTPAQIIAAVRPDLPADLFPDGATAGWWVKAAQLDQEAKGTIWRAATLPMRLWRA